MSDKKDYADASPYVVVFAGPNGSGKTSLIDELRETGLQTSAGMIPIPSRFINPDQVGKDLQGTFANQHERDVAAFNAAVQMRHDASNSKESFAFETVMSHPSRINEILMLKEQGYRVFLTFVTTDDPEKNVARVTYRYQSQTTTGHYVDPDKVRDRYDRTLALLPRATEEADAAFVYDNSADFKQARLQAVQEKDAVFQLSPEAKPWVIDRLVQPLQQREEELNQLIASAMKHGHELGDVDELRGTYRGPIVLKTPHFVMQHDEATRKPVIHDRVMLETGDSNRPEYSNPTHRQSDTLAVRYSTRNAPAISRVERGPGSEQVSLEVLNERAAAMAKAFTSQAPADALQTYPELAGAYAAMTMMKKTVEGSLTREQSTVVMDCVRSQIANQLAKGEIPEVPIREQVEHTRDIERSR